ncbi:hypothetical protein [Nocardiopsis ansamitocini]|uniref:Uncharacterized protein n=1 Tax=Nocardiopsis ansamitocini TaxID=1670832 RepID=A0A9W6P4T2_9ACTN|nr:hypothetical protein [Nocardiopsis ansamitocini]GLU47098.1 hypothetical protein Nans01_14490 [Nocardiopsis ansamitocini]
MATRRSRVRQCVRTLLRLPGLRAGEEALEAARVWGPFPVASAERAYREQLHVIVWLLEDGRTQEAIDVACQGPWRHGDGARGPVSGQDPR